MIWFAESQGPTGFPGAFAGDRPFLAMIYVITTAVLKSDPFQWQILGLLSRWLFAVTAWWWYREMWPEEPVQAGWMGILIAIFPGFKQQPISVVYSNGLFLIISYVASHALLIKAMHSSQKKRRILLFILSFFTYAFCLFSTEYYIGLDILRGVMIWLLISRSSQNFKQRLVRTLRIWAPFLALLFLFLFWRIFIFSFPTYQPSLLESLPQNTLATIGSLFLRMLSDPIIAGVQSWTATFHLPELGDFSATSSIFSWALIVGSSIFSFIFFKIQSKPQRDIRSSKEVFTLAAIALLFAGFPFWITGLPITLTYPYDRFLLAFMIGSGLLMIAMLDGLLRTATQKIILLSLIIGFSTGANFENANTYRREWLTHNDLFWQMSWRAPSIKEDTILLTYNLPFRYYSDNSLTAPLNLLYDPSNHTLDLSYYLALINVRLGRSIPALEKGLDIEQSFRNAMFTGSTSQGLVFFYSPPGCLRILDPQRDASLPILPIEYGNAISLSDPDRIDVFSGNAMVPNEMLFGKEPAHGWCYFFQKADLSRQQGDWAASRDYFDEAFQNGLFPYEASEYLLYLEALFHTGDPQYASSELRMFYFENPGLRMPICDMLSRVVSVFPSITGYEEFRSLLETTDCAITH